MQNFLSKNLYFTCCFFVLLGAIATYTYFYNREALSSSTDELSQENTVETLEKIIVDVSGAVENPGVYTLQNGARLADLISLSGGVTFEVSQKWLSRNLNLAATLKDQQKIYIPFEWEVVSSFPEYELKELALESTTPSTGVSSGSSNALGVSDDVSSGGASSGTDNSSTDALINLNLATQKELETLPKVGEVTAKKIIDFRPYAGFEDLKEKTGIYDSVIEAIRELVTF